MKPISVFDRLPEESGEYMCIRYGMPYRLEPIEFFAAEDEDETHSWSDTFGHMNAGGGGVRSYNKLSNREKYWRTNYGRVMFWFEPVENHMNHHAFTDYMLQDLANRGIDPEECDGEWDRIEMKEVLK